VCFVMGGSNDLTLPLYKSYINISADQPAFNSYFIVIAREAAL